MKKVFLILAILMISLLSFSYNETPSDPTDAPHEHSFGEWYAIEESSCTEKGLSERICECGEVEREEVAPSHRYVDVVIPANCLSKGCTLHVCECGASYRDSFTSSLGDHTYDDSMEVTPPTYYSQGYTTYFCICGRSRIDNYTPALKDDPSAISLLDVYLVAQKSSNNSLIYAVDKLTLGVKRWLGVDLKVDEGTSHAYELLIGNTGRPESEALLAECGEGELAIRVINNKIVIVASDELMLYEAVDVFLSSYVKTQEGAADPLILSSIDIVKKGDVNSLYYTMMTGSGDLWFSSEATHKLTNTKYYNPNESYLTHIYRRQGGCFNGKNMYQATLSVNEELSVISKKDIATGEVTYSEPMTMGHANDVTYNPYTNKIYVVNSAFVYVYDADTLEYVETIKSAVSGSGIDFNPERNVFLFKGGSGFSTANDTLSEYLGSVFTSKISGYTSQGICSDDTFIYYLLCVGIGGSKYTTHLAIYDWYGNFVRFMTIEISGNYEPENISVVDGQIYIGACTPVPTVTLFKVDLSSVQVTDTDMSEIEETEVIFDATADPKKAFTHVNDYASDDADPYIQRRRASFFDGTYFYQAYVNTAGDLGVIAKKNVRTDEVIYSEPCDLDHARGIAYDPIANTITVSGKSKYLYVFDADTLEFIKEIQLPVTVNSISYNVKTGQYVGLTSKEINIFDSDLSVVSTYNVKIPTGYTAHAMTVDENGLIYIACIKSAGSERYTCAVAIYEPGESKYSKLISYDLDDNHESPGISVVNGAIYVTGCTPLPEVTLYKLNIR